MDSPQTNAVGLVAKAGRYGGTYAHKDIAFEFGMWISAEFKIYLIKEFQRLKETEYQQMGWDTGIESHEGLRHYGLYDRVGGRRMPGDEAPADHPRLEP